MARRRVRRRKKKLYTRILRRMKRHLWFVFMVICVLFLGLIGRLAYIEYTSGERYERIILSQQKYDSSLIPFQRGDITDVHGTVLATSVDVYNVILDCKVLNANEKQIDSTIARLSECFPEIDTGKVRTLLAEEPDKQYTILARKVPYDDMRRFEGFLSDPNVDPKVQLEALQKVREEVKGIWFEKEYERQYPYKSLAASLIGFTASGNVGMGGVELSYNDYLSGTNGRSYGFINVDSNMESAVVEPENGLNVSTTIDVNIQTIVEKEIRNFNREYEGNGGLGSKHTAVLVMNPQDGSILAMANYPTFDLNNPWSLKKYYSSDVISGMSEEERTDSLNNLWQNFCITSTYEPGSTFKPFTVACGLETGKMSGNESYYCDGVEHIADYDVHCVNRQGHGMLDVRGALVESCNDCFMQMSYVIGADNFADYQRLFGFGQRTGIDLPGEAMTDQLLYNRDELRSVINIATNSFGQNFNTTMVQLGSAFASLINGGNLYLPHVVDHISDDAGNIIRSFGPVIEKKTVSIETSNMMKDYLYSVVNDGSASMADVNGYDIGGKTGTAQKLPRAAAKYLVSFIGYVPQENPKVLIYCIVDEPNVGDQAHSTYAQGIVHNV
ncbi:MAG: penicillin-binding protein 2, partial [Lachnospiraceae bacterium]|nr:penicillin-binding protein 2 [Lachnospiraceae bacterium]